jgi:NAD(P)-dependent dehydrogenase (short-subunit alcohol dehydrogenase family)
VLLLQALVEEGVMTPRKYLNVSSLAGLIGNQDLPACVASKHSVIGLSKSVSTVCLFL